MEIEGKKYALVVTSANDFETLSLECTLDDELIIEAELVSYSEKQARLHFHRQGLSLRVVEAFIHEVNQELTHGGQHQP